MVGYIHRQAYVGGGDDFIVGGKYGRVLPNYGRA